MRKIERQMLQALVEVKDWSKDNTRVETNGYYSDVYLHGHRIAVFYPSTEFRSMQLHINNCGYETNTTKSRLNALIKFVVGPARNGIFQSNWNWYLVRDGKQSEFPSNEWVAI